MAKPFIDLASFDLSRTLFVREDLERHLQQRGTFAAVDGVLHFGADDGLIIGYKDVRSDDWWVKDHLPGRPIFPGMLMVEASAQLGTFDFLERNPGVGNPFIGFVGIDKARFRGVVQPDCRLILVAKAHRMRGTLFTYQVQGFVEEKLVFETEVTGMKV